MRLLVPLASVWAVRNVLRAGLAVRLGLEFDVVLAVPEGRLDAGALGAPAIEFPVVSTKSLSYRRLRQRLGNAHIWRTSPLVAHYMQELRSYRRSVRARASVAFWNWVARWESAPRRYESLVARAEAVEAGLDEERRVLAWLQEVGASAVLFVNPESQLLRPVARAARRLRLRTVGLIHSFDNLSTKGRHPILYDDYLVWSDDMASELRVAYPEIPAGRIHATGTTHFHVYDSPLYAGTRKELLDAFDLDPNRPLILFAAGPNDLIPHEVPIVERLAEDLSKLPSPSRPQLVVRLHPWERQRARWQDLARRVPSLRWSFPWKSNEEDPSWALPSVDDIRKFRLLMRHASVVINSASTMTLDAAICDTPAICVDYCLPPFESFARHLHNFYDYDHYRPITASGAARMARSAPELVEHVLAYLRDPSLDRGERRQLVDRMCAATGVKAVEQIAQVLERLLMGDRELATTGLHL